MTKWYTNLEIINGLVTYPRILINLRHFNNIFGDTRINDIVQEDLENYQIKRKRENYADATIDLEVQQAQAMLNKAWENDKISHEVIKPFRTLANLLIDGANARKQHVSLEIYYKLLSKANNLLRPILIIAYNTGMRHGEILKLKWSHVDLKASFIRLTKADTKEGKAKSVPLNKYVVQPLSEISPVQRLSSEYVFTRNGKTIRDMTDYMRFLCKRAGVPYGSKVQEGITFHDFRRTAKTFMLKAGVDKVYRDKILGHALHGMDKHYMVVEDEDLTRAMKKYTDYLDKKTSELANVYQNVYQK